MPKFTKQQMEDGVLRAGKLMLAGLEGNSVEVDNLVKQYMQLPRVEIGFIVIALNGWLVGATSNLGNLVDRDPKQLAHMLIETRQEWEWNVE